MIDGQPDLIASAERMTPHERITEAIDADIYDWIGRGYRDQLVVLIKQNEERRSFLTTEGFARLNNKLARAVSCLGEVLDYNSPENQQKWQDALYHRLFGKEGDSIVNAMGKGFSAEIAWTIRGSLAPLTLSDLIKQSRPELRDNLRISKIVTSPDVDAHGKVDLVLELGDKNMYDQPIIRLVQLKSNKEARQAQIDIIQDDNLSAVRFIKSEEAKKVLAVGEIIKKARKGVEVRAFVVEVPGIESEAVGKDPFGHIHDPEVVKKFGRDAVDIGFIPARQRDAAAV